MSQWMKLQQTYWREWMTFTEKSMESMMGMAKTGCIYRGRKYRPMESVPRLV